MSCDISAQIFLGRDDPSPAAARSDSAAATSLSRPSTACMYRSAAAEEEWLAASAEHEAGGT